MAKRSKLNPRQEKFVREYVKTGNGRRSYQAAGYSAQLNDTAECNPVDAAASRLLKSGKVESAIVAQMTRHRTRHDYTVDTILAELDEARTVAIPGQPSAAVSASVAKARILGMIVDRKEVGSPGDFAALDTAQAILTLVSKELGPDIAKQLANMTGEVPPTIDLQPTSSKIAQPISANENPDESLEPSD